MSGSVDQRVEAERGTRGCADQVADAGRAAARAERRRLARDLHDSVTQTLISLHLTAQAAAELWDSQPAQARAALETIRHLATGATTEMRALLVDLHESVLERHGLVGAIEVHSSVVRQRSGLQVEVRVAGTGAQGRAEPPSPSERLPVPHEEALYRIVQEALANVVKHARASRATITLVRNTTICVCVEDDGVGFGVSMPTFTYGLSGMRERAAALGGALHLENRHTGGARVMVELPLPVPTLSA
jgi:signal transduction histidine kinase